MALWRSFWKKPLFYLVILFIAGLVLVRYTAQDIPFLSPVNLAVKEITAPLERAGTFISRTISDFFQGVVSYRSVKAENERLKKKIAALEAENRRLKEFEYRSLRLQDQLNYKEATAGQFEMMLVSVIARDPGTNWLRRLTINAGSEDGIAKNMVVVTYEGLVGKVVSVSPHTAEVALILDPNAGAVGGLVQVTRTMGVVEGMPDQSGLLRMIHLPQDAPIRENQLVVTSGLGGVYPKGIPIGRVVKIQPESNNILKSAVIRPLVDFDRLEEVFVITKVVDSSMPYPAQGE